MPKLKNKKAQPKLDLRGNLVADFVLCGSPLATVGRYTPLREVVKANQYQADADRAKQKHRKYHFDLPLEALSRLTLLHFLF